MSRPRYDAAALGDALTYLAHEMESDFLAALANRVYDLGNVDVTLVESPTSVWLVGVPKEGQDVPDPGDGES